MHQEKKITREDTWKTDELRKHIRGGGHEEDRGRRREEYERQHRGAESLERRPRDPEREARRERDKQRDERKNREKERHLDRRTERLDDRMGDREEREKGRRRETDKGADSSRYQDGDRESRDRIHYRGDKENRDREKERTRERGKEKDITKDRERERHRDREKEAEERERHRGREKEAEERERHRGREKEAEERERHRGREKEAEERERHRGREKEAEERERHRGREKEAEERERHRDREKEAEDRERHRGREKEAEERERHRDREKEAEEREGERRREERERRREDESNNIRKDKDRRQESSRRDEHKEREHLEDSEHRDKRKDRERRERHSDREHTEHREHRRKEREDKERRHRQKPQADAAESRRHDSDPKEAAHKERKRSEDRHRADREGAERDRLRERRRREEDDPKREEPAERSRDKRSHQDPKEKRDVKTKEVLGQSESVWRSSHKELSDTEEPVEKQEHLTECQHDDEGDVQDYEEDFEDYEEDFEEGSESGGEEEEKQTPSQEEEREEREEKEELSPQTRKQIEAIQRAMKEENDRIGSSQTRPNVEEEEEEEEEDRPRRTRGSETRPQQGKFIDFVAAKHREVNKKVTGQQKKRSVELLRLIDLDYSITFSLLDLPPVNEYDMYIKSFGTTNTKQAYVQCNEDNSDRGVQTEELESSEMWTQHPAEWNAVCGGPNLAQEDPPSSSKMNADSQHLLRFLRSASQVVAVLLEEDRAETQSLQKLKTPGDTGQSFSDGSLQLNTKLPFLHGHPISLLHFSHTQTQTMLSVHSPTEKPSAVRLDSNTIICVWNIWEPSRPQQILLYESEVRSCCLSPGKATLVFAGTSVGSVVLWDLREPAADHNTLSIGDMDWTLRHPTFSTDAVLAASGHVSSVSSVEAVPAAVSQSWGPEHPLLASDEESSGLSFQLASLDENGVLNLWVVLELPKPNDAGSQTDLGLRPGGKVKLLHSSTLLTSERKSTRDAIKTSPPQALLIKFLPSDPSHFFIGTNMGLVNHGTNHGLKAPPKFYRPTLVGARPVDVTCIDFSPFEGTLFLVGCGDGSVRLHTVASERPVLEWSGSTAGVPVVAVQWAQTRPAVFCVLDATSTLHMWDLLERDAEPVVTENSEADRVTAMAAFGDPTKQNMFSGIALARQSGKIEMQYFSKRFTVPDSADLEKLHTLKDEAFLD